jgi:hypothetical protein
MPIEPDSVGLLVYLIVCLFLLVLSILWILLPFAVFGVKDRLDAILEELRLIRAALPRVPATPTAVCPDCQRRIPIPDAHVGDSQQCPHCGGTFTLE